MMLALLRAVLLNGHYPLWLQFIGEKKLPEGQKANSNLNFKMLSVQVFAGVGLGTFHLFLLILM